MRSERNRHRLFSRRAFLLGGIQLGFISILAGRLYYLQGIKGKKYRTLSDNNRIRLLLIPPARGRIIDRRGIAMAENVENYQLFLEPERIKSGQPIVDILEKLLSLPKTHWDETRKRMKEYGSPAPFLLAEHLTWDDVSRIEVNTTDLPGVSVQVGQVRHYTYDDAAAHVIGYVGAASEKDTQERALLLRMPDLKVGKQGIERQFEDTLQGQAGVRHLEVNAHGLSVRELAVEPSQPGQDVRLTIDMELQQYAYARMEGESAAATIMDVNTGEVYALVSGPAFDPNRFSTNISPEYWQQLTSNPKSPLLNKAIAGMYPPGSTFKMLVALAALEHNSITPDGRIYCPGFMKLGRHRFNCWKRVGHGWMDMQQALEQSCDTYFYHLSQKLGIEPIAEMARRFGLDYATDIELPGEKSGLIPDKEWKLKTLGTPWLAGETVNASIGQGYVLATPLQLAVMTARLASGKAVTPTLLKRIEGEGSSTHKPREFNSLGIPEAHLEQVRAGMNRVVNYRRGTAYMSRIREEEYAFSGKTGTSQVRRLQHGVPEAEIPWKYRHHALFVGFAPRYAPKFAISVVVEHGGGGSRAAAPIARSLLLAAQKKLGDPVDLPDEDDIPPAKENENG